MPFPEMGDGRWWEVEKKPVHFCPCEAEAPLSHPGGAVEKAGDV